MDIAHIALREGQTRAVRRMQHGLARLLVRGLVAGALEVAANEVDCLNSAGTGLLGGAASDVGLCGVNEGVDTCGGGDVLGQARGHLPVEHSVAGYEGEVVDGVLVVGLTVCDDCCKRGLAAGTGCGGHRNDQRGPPHDLEDAAHLGDGLVGAGQACAAGLGAVHGAAASKGDEAVAALLEIEVAGGLDVVDGGVADHVVVDKEIDARAAKSRLEPVNQAQPVHTLVRDDERALQALVAQHAGGGVHAPQDNGVAVGQQRQRSAQGSLEQAAVHRAKSVHEAPQM